jgi:aminopeptidase N
LALIAVLLGGCGTLAKGSSQTVPVTSVPDGAYPAARDPYSYAEPDRFLIRQVTLDLRADFSAHRLEGKADLTVERIDPAAGELRLDTRDLEIHSVQLLDEVGKGRDL